MPDLRGQVLIVTSATGIGAATGRPAGAAGARLAIATGDEQSGWELAAETGAECWVGDLTRPSSGESIVAQCLAKFARVDALFNAAGLSGRRFGDGPAHECTDGGCRAGIRRTPQQNVTEPGGRGAILNMGSVLDTSPEPRHFATHAHAAAKGGVVALSRSMAAVRSLSICPV